MLGIPASYEAVKLMHRSMRVLAEMTCDGFPVDVEYVRTSITQCHSTMKAIEEEAWAMDGGKEWKKKYGASATLSNPTQCKYIFFDLLGFTPESEGSDDESSDSLDKDALADIDHPLADLVGRHRKLDKCAGTFLKNLLVEQVDGRVHPCWSLCIASSYRTSCTDPNAQNYPIRDPETGEFVRRSIKAPKGWRLVEGDYSGIEVGVANCYHKDPTMTKYLLSGYDMHTDMAAECYRITKEQVTKRTRYSAKNGFVFPEFYGSFWRQVAVSLWKNMSRLSLETTDSVPLRAHLATTGIHELGKLVFDQNGNAKAPPGSFYKHIEEVESGFWKTRFPVYDQWRKDWYAAYLKQGHFESLTGFSYSGLFRRNQVINLPVQGSASHLKLMALINMHAALAGMESHLILEIHDSIIGLVKDEEFDDFIPLMIRTMVDMINRDVPWLVTPVKIEIEATPSGGSWYEKKVVLTS